MTEMKSITKKKELGIDFSGVTQKFQWIEPGTFLMGSSQYENVDRSEDLHPVTLTKGFWMADTTCIQKVWESIMGGNPCKVKGDYLPVEQISHLEVLEFTKKISSEKLKFRLPTEAEWEHACRAGTTTTYSFGQDIDVSQVNFDSREFSRKPGDNSKIDTNKVNEFRGCSVIAKSLPCNQWKLYGMHGNVQEWCKDWFITHLGTEHVVDPRGGDTGITAVVKGGDWFYPKEWCRSAHRQGCQIDQPTDISFRLVLEF